MAPKTTGWRNRHHHVEVRDDKHRVRQRQVDDHVPKEKSVSRH